MGSVRTELNSALKNLRFELKLDFNVMRSEMKSYSNDIISETNLKLNVMRTELKETRSNENLREGASQPPLCIEKCWRKALRKIERLDGEKKEIIRRPAEFEDRLPR